MKHRLFIAALALGTLACQAKQDEPIATGDDSNDPDDAGEAGTLGGTGMVDDSATGGVQESGSSDGGQESTGDDDDGVIFVVPKDGGGEVFECDLWAQDCPDGEKCMPWASSGGTWDGTRCTDVTDSPDQPGDTCTVEGNGASGLDSCEIGAMCWDVDPETNEGTCVAMCQGDEGNPICENPDTVCTIANGGALILCLASCDPLLQTCVEGQACYPVNDDFACAPDVSGATGAFGDPCEFINVCDPGLFCLGADTLTTCAGSGGCCTSVCDSADAGADAACAAMDPGTACELWYQEGQAPPGYEDVGVCVVPA